MRFTSTTSPYSVSFDGGDLEGEMKTIYTNHSVLLPESTFTLGEYDEFVGWEINGETYLPNEKLEVTENVTAKLLWKEHECLDDDKNQDNNWDNKVEDKVENDNEINLSFYSEEEMKEYQNYVRKELGEFDGIIHEIVSDDIHIDIIVIPPTKENNYYKLVTMGMGAYKMNVPKELKKYRLERAELVLYLPSNWDINSKLDEDYWPIKQLKTLARLPINSNSWLCVGHTVSNDINNSKYASNTNLCSMLLILAYNNKYEMIKINF